MATISEIPIELEKFEGRRLKYRTAGAWRSGGIVLDGDRVKGHWGRYTIRDLVAERLSLLVTSFVLFFYEAAGLQIQRINLFGNEVALSDPWWVSVALWTLWDFLGKR